MKLSPFNILVLVLVFSFVWINYAGDIFYFFESKSNTFSEIRSDLKDIKSNLKKLVEIEESKEH